MEGWVVRVARVAYRACAKELPNTLMIDLS